MRTFLIFLSISLLLFLCPGPSFWYGITDELNIQNKGFLYLIFLEIQKLMVQIEENSEAKQLGAHFILIAVCAFDIIRFFSAKWSSFQSNKWKIISLSIIFIFALSFIIEILQSILPSSFARGFAWIDIVFSLFGGFVGILVFLFWNRNKELI